MTKSNLDSDDMRTIERVEHKNKLKKNIKRLFNCYVLSQNQNGGDNNKLSFQIKKKLDKKIGELIVHPAFARLDKNYLKYLEGGVIEFISAAMVALLTTEIYAAIKHSMYNTDFDLKKTIKAILDKHLDKKLTDIPFFDPWTTYESVLDKYKKDKQQQQQQQQQQYQPQYYQQQQQQQQQQPIHNDEHKYLPPPIHHKQHQQQYQQQYQPQQPIQQYQPQQPPVQPIHQYKPQPPPVQPIHPLQPIQDFFNIFNIFSDNKKSIR